MKNELQRSIKTPGAILMGLGSIIGTGIFVSIAIATQISGNGVLIAIIIAGLLAVFNGLSSAQLAAAHPVSGGTYEYGYRFLGSYYGFSAGWMFMIAKSASAATAVLGVLLNLILGLSRVLLGMARRRDVPNILSAINPKTKSPVLAVSVTAVIIGLLVLSGDVIFTWSFSAFTVLIYYSITNLSALMMPKELHLYPRWIPVMGLFGCLFLAFWIEPMIWSLGLALLAAGLLWHTVALRMQVSSEL